MCVCVCWGGGGGMGGEVLCHKVSEPMFGPVQYNVPGSAPVKPDVFKGL